MNKIGLAVGVTALSTLALCGGAFGLLSKNPKFQNLFGIKVNNDEIVSKLKNDILNKDKEIANLQNSNTEKDNQILGQQATIEELTDIVSTIPKKYNIVFTEDMLFPSGVTLLNISEDVVLFSSAGNKGTKGLWKFNKSTGEIIKLLDSGFNYLNVFKLSDGRNLLLNGSSNTFAICDNLFNEFNFYNASGTSLLCSTYSFKTYENDTYFVFSYSNVTWSLNKQTSNLISLNADFKYSYVVDNNLVSFYNSSYCYIFSLEDGSKEQISSTSQYLPIETEKGVYLLSTTGLSKFDYETRTITLLQDGLTISSLGIGAKLYKDGIYFNYSKEKNSATSCLIDIKEEKVYVLGKCDVQEIISLDDTDNKLLVKGANSCYYVNRSEGIFKSFDTSSIYNLLILNNNYMAFKSSTTADYLQFFDISQNKVVLSIGLNNIEFHTFEDLGDGKYKLIAEDGIGVFDSVNTTFTMTSIVIE